MQCETQWDTEKEWEGDVREEIMDARRKAKASGERRGAKNKERST